MWKSLLSWSSNQSKGYSDTAPSRMTEEDKEFLRNVIAEVDKAPSSYDIFKELLTKLQPEEEEDKLLEYLEHMDDLSICHPELARDLEKLGGLDPLLVMLDNRNSPAVEATMQLLADCFSLNPEVQEIALSKGALEKAWTPFVWDCDKLNAQYQTEPPKTLRQKALGMIASLVRHVPKGEEMFVENDGLKVLTTIISDNSERPTTRRRAIALVHHFETQCAALMPNDIQKLLVTSLVTLLGERDEYLGPDLGEASANLLVILREKAIPFENMPEVVKERIEFLESKRREENPVQEEIDILQSVVGA